MVIWDRVTRDEVMRAITEYDRLGPAEFFSAHGFGPTTTYDLVWDGHRYPPKAILGTAYEFATGQRLARVGARLLLVHGFDRGREPADGLGHRQGRPRLGGGKHVGRLALAHHYVIGHEQLAGHGHGVIDCHRVSSGGWSLGK